MTQFCSNFEIVFYRGECASGSMWNFRGARPSDDLWTIILIYFDVHTLWLLQSRVPFTIYTRNDVYILLLTFLTFTHLFTFVSICDHILYNYIHHVYIYMFCIYLGFVGVPFHSWVTKWCHTINLKENSLQGAPLKLLFMQVWWGWTWTINKLVPIFFDHCVMALMLWTAGC